MAYAPGQTYIGAQLLSDAFGGAIENLQKGWDRTEEIRKQNQLNDPIMQHALEMGRITQDQYNKYHESNFTTKASMANGVMANVADDWKRQMFAKEEEDKRLQRELQLKIAGMQQAGPTPSPWAQTPVYGADGVTPIGIRDERGEPHFFPGKAGGASDLTGKPIFSPDGKTQIGFWNESGTAQFYPDKSKGEGAIKIDRTTLPGTAIVTKEGSGQFQILPQPGQPPGSVMTGPGVPANTYTVGPKGNLVTLPKDVRQRLEDAALPPPSPTPTPFGTNLYNSTIGRFNNAMFGTPTPTPTVTPPLAPTATPGPVAAPAQTPVPSVVAPAPVSAGRVIILNPEGVPHSIPAERLPDYLNAGWTQPPPGG